VRVDAPGEEATIFVLYSPYKPGISCGEIAQNLDGFLNVEYTMSYFDQIKVAENFPAGEVFTTRATRSRKQPETEVSRSIVCAAGRVAVVVFGYPSGYPQSARDLVMRTLSFENSNTSANSHESFVGDWTAQDGVLTLNADGSANLSYNGSFLSNRGRYAIKNGTISFTWTQMLVPGRSAQWNCSYSIRASGTQLFLACNPGPTSWNLRR
jgi:hypothetical protein